MDYNKRAIIKSDYKLKLSLKKKKKDVIFVDIHYNI